MSTASRNEHQVRNYLAANKQGEFFRQYTAFATGNPESGSVVPSHIRNILTDALLVGYSIYAQQNSQKLPQSPLFLQKCLCNDRGDKLFFIEIYLWDFMLEEKALHLPRDIFRAPRVGMPHLPMRATTPEDSPLRRVGIAPHAQFQQALERTANVDAFVNENDTLETIEAFYMHFYRSMHCEPYERGP